MAFRHVLLAAAITGIVAATVSAQTTTPVAVPAQTPAAGTTARDAAAPAAVEAGDGQRPTADTDRTESTGDFNVAGDVSATALIGAKIRNGNKDTIGTVEDLFVDDQGAIATVVVSVGGFLGVGARSVGVKWSDIKRRRDGSAVVLTTALGKNELEALPPYIAQLRKPAPKDQAAAPR
jgi:hypothetical protein